MYTSVVDQQINGPALLGHAHNLIAKLQISLDDVNAGNLSTQSKNEIAIESCVFTMQR